MADQSSGPVIVVNSLLCYALAKFSKMETLQLRSIICGFYSVDEVCGAKRQLLADIEQRKLLDSDICYKTHTVDNDFCAEMEMETDDIQDALWHFEIWQFCSQRWTKCRQSLLTCTM